MIALNDEVVYYTRNSGKTWGRRLLSGIILPQEDMEEGEIPIGCELPARVRDYAHKWWICSDMDVCAKWALITKEEFNIWLKSIGFNKN